MIEDFYYTYGEYEEDIDVIYYRDLCMRIKQNEKKVEIYIKLNWFVEGVC